MGNIQDPRTGTTDVATVDPTFKSLRTSWRPIEQEGAYRVRAISGNTAAATAASTVSGATPTCLFSFRYTGTGVALIQNVRIGLNMITAYTQGAITYLLYCTRNFITPDATGGTLVTGTNATTGQFLNKLRDQMIPSQTQIYIATTGLLSAGVGQNDPQPMGVVTHNMTSAIGGIPQADFFSFGPLSVPLILTPNEGFRILNENAYAATGVSNLVISVDWLEEPSGTAEYF